MFALRFRLRRKQQLLRIARDLDMDLAGRVRRLLFLLLGLCAVHVIAMMGLEGMGLRDAIWLTLTTVTTVGYGDLSATTPAGQFATVALLYVIGISLLAQLASDYIDHRMERRQRMLEGRWVWKMQDHILIVNTPRHNAQRYCELLVRQIRETPQFSDLPVQLLTTEFADGLPDSLRELGVVHRHDAPDNNQAWEATHLTDARYVVILAHDHHDRRTDGLTFDVAHRVLERVDPNRTHVVAECVDDTNRERLKKLGVQSVIRPIRAYPELVIRAIVAPGVEHMMENLFTHHGDHSQRYDVDIRNVRWADVVSSLIQHDWGTAMAYVDRNGEVVCNPPAHEPINAKALLVMVRADQAPSSSEMGATLASL